MPRYGDLEKIEKELTEIILDYLRDGSVQCNIAAGVACDIRDNVINNAPTADVVEVVHGRWIASHDEFCACSICKYPVYVWWNQTNYCPNCGAKMGADTQEREGV